jgi:hypothetical protein
VGPTFRTVYFGFVGGGLLEIVSYGASVYV